MLRRLTLWLVVIFIGLSPGLCEEVAYAFREVPCELDHAALSDYNGSEMITFTVAGGSDGYRISHEKSAAATKEDFDKRVDICHPTVVYESRLLASEYPGDYTIEQVCSIYDNVSKSWNYIPDPIGREYYCYANETIKLGREVGLAGVGDCDDFAILMAALIGNIGGLTRIVMAYGGPYGNHAYTEVYLGKMNTENRNVERIIESLKEKYNTEDINCHINMSTDDTWLNLDRGTDPNTPSPPGRSFHLAKDHMPIFIGDLENKVPIMPPNELPSAVFAFASNAGVPTAGYPITFNASQSIDRYGRDRYGNVCGSIDKYEWNLGDGMTAEGVLVEHTYSEGGVFTVNLTVIDNEGAEGSNTTEIQVNTPPVAHFVYSINKVKSEFGWVHFVRFDASESKDEDGSITSYEWDFGEGATDRGISPKRFYEKYGTFLANLTVVDDKGAKSTESQLLKINEGPIAEFSQDAEDKVPNPGDKITFDASLSKDNDGNITEYKWYFGDGANATGIVAEHAYSEGGNFIVKLEVEDDDNATNSISRAISVNALPVSVFTYEPKMSKLDEKITFDASQSRDDDGEIACYEWDFGDGSPIHTSKRQTHSYSLNGSFTVTLTVTDDNGAKSSYTTKRIIGPIITSHQDGDKVARVTTLMGECPQEIDDAVWIFVANKPPLVEEILYYPQSMNPSIGESTPKINGKWEMKVIFGGIDPNHVGEPFDILLTVADAQASQSISDYLIRCHENNRTYIGLEDLPKGVTVVERIEVVRTEEDIGSPPDISNVQLSGQASIDIQNGAVANESVYISGEYISEVKDHIWVLVRPSGGRWYPQSIDPSSERYEGHTDMIGGEWSTKCQFGDNQTEKGEPFDIVMVLADEDASANFVEFQNECYKNNETYPGLLTIELPRGIDEKDRVRVYRDIKQYEINETTYVDLVNPDPCNYRYASIREAIQHVKEGGSIFVYNGTYTEKNLTVNKTISIIGESTDTVIIESDVDNECAFHINADNIVIRNLSISKQKYGICTSSKNFTLINSAIDSCEYGVFLQKCGASNISFNNINNASIGGVYLVDSDNCNIYGNLISGARDADRYVTFGIRLNESSNGNISCNKIANFSYGVLLTNSQVSLMELESHNEFINVGRIVYKWRSP